MLLIDCQEMCVKWALRQLGVEEWLVQTVMVMYEKARTTVRTKQGSSEEFEVKGLEYIRDQYLVRYCL